MEKSMNLYQCALLIHLGEVGIDAIPWDKQNEIIEMFSASGEMPTNVANSHDGDPHNWVSDKLCSMSDEEFSEMFKND